MELSTEIKKILQEQTAVAVGLGLDRAIQAIERRRTSWTEMRDNAVAYEERLIAVSKLNELDVLFRILQNEKEALK